VEKSQDVKCVGIDNIQSKLDCVYREEKHEVTVTVSEVSGSNVPKLVVFNVTGFRNPDETA
jgi:hypothetical protein